MECSLNGFGPAALTKAFVMDNVLFYLNNNNEYGKAQADMMKYASIRIADSTYQAHDISNHYIFEESKRPEIMSH